jgi:transposase
MACVAAAEQPNLPGRSLERALSLPGKPFGKGLRLVESGGHRTMVVGRVAIYHWDAAERDEENLAAAIVLREGLATQVELAEVLGRHRNTMYRLNRRARDRGLAGVIREKPGPKGPYKVTPVVREVVTEGVAEGRDVRALGELVLERTGIRVSARHVGRLASEAVTQQSRSIEDELEPTHVLDADVALSSPEDATITEEATSARTLGDDAGPEPCPAVVVLTADGVAAMTEVEACGEPAVMEVSVTLPDKVQGRNLGAALYFPALHALGLLEAARNCFRLPNSCEFDVRPTILTLFFLTVLGRTRVQMAKYLMRWEFAALIGAPRAPALRTLRRKLAELVEQGRAAEFGRQLARRWVAVNLIATAYLYIDGHVKAYGGKRKLQEVWNTKRRMATPSLSTFHVGDQKGRPLLFLAQPAGGSMTAAMPDIVNEIRLAVGDRRFTVLFDRGGFDSKLFVWLLGEGVDFITYQRGSVQLPRSSFTKHRVLFEGRRRYLWLAEDSVEIKDSGPWRRIVFLDPKDGQQIPILTSLGPEVSAAKIVCLLFARWRQENFFLNACRHVGLDDIASYAFEAVPGERLVANPERGQLDAQIRELRHHLDGVHADLGRVLLEAPWEHRTVRQLEKLATGFQKEIDLHLDERKNIPKHVPAAALGQREQLRLEQKSIIDRVKLAAYNAHEWTVDRLLVHYPYPDDVRDLLRSFAQLDGEMRCDGHRLLVLLAAPDTPRHRRALRDLCDDLNTIGATYPGTDVPVTYQVRIHQSERAA